MKQVKSFLTLAFALTALASCNKENEVPGMNPEVEGVPTYAAFSVKVSSTANTRATTPTDANGVAEEQKISTLQVFIFSGGVLEAQGLITLDANNEGTTALKTTTGSKEIYALANPKSDMVLTTGASLADFKTLAVKALTTDADPDAPVADANIAAENAFVMIGKTDATLTVAHPSTNPEMINITVSRGAAKVQMQYRTTGPNKVTQSSSLKGTFSAPKYLVAQMNTKMFLPREGYEWTPNSAIADKKDDNGDYTYDHLTPIPADMTNAKVAQDPNPDQEWDNTFASSFYTAENVNEAPFTGNTTFALVQLKYVPDASEINGNNTTIVGGTFYLLWNKTSKTGKIYADKNEADVLAAADSENLLVKTYAGGLCYYRVNLRDITQNQGTSAEILRKKYSVLRNHYYKINITQINSLGGSTTTDPDVVVPTDPDTPLETETYISADITIEAWNAIIMNEPLG